MANDGGQIRNKRGGMNRMAAVRDMKARVAKAKPGNKRVRGSIQSSKASDYRKVTEDSPGFNPAVHGNKRGNTPRTQAREAQLTRVPAAKKVAPKKTQMKSLKAMFTSKGK